MTQKEAWHSKGSLARQGNKSVAKIEQRTKLVMVRQTKQAR